MVENLGKLKLMFLIEEKIFDIYTKIKENMYNNKNYDILFKDLIILIELENSELNKLQLDYYYLESLKEKILNEDGNQEFNEWNIEAVFLNNLLIESQKRNIKGENLFKYNYLDKKQIIELRVFQKLNLLQTKCANYPFYSLDDVIEDSEFECLDEYIYIDDIEMITGIYTDKDYDIMDYYEYIDLALKDDYVLALNSELRERLYLEAKADYYLNCYYIYNLDKENNPEISNYYIDNMLNMVYIVPLLEERLMKSNFDLKNKDNCISTNIYKNKNNLKFLNIIKQREFVSNCEKFLNEYCLYNDYNIINYYSSYKNNNIITEFVNIKMIISNIKACFYDKTRSTLLYSINKFVNLNKLEDNNVIFNMLMEDIGKQESKVKIFSLK